MMMLSSGDMSLRPAVGCDRSCRMPLVSLSGLLVAEAGAEELVGVVISIGSLGEGADVLMVGVSMGTVLAPIESSGRSRARCVLCALSVTVAICPVAIRKKRKSVRECPREICAWCRRACRSRRIPSGADTCLRRDPIPARNHQRE